ncbi:hypothetical protein Cgig2_021922 [Carnegiea gigantea]|uniref:Uncharacterized protein n=1 Tax=Carnegiea gigantea TaxID=171969 RepID=A0A9Q1GQ13_9CARY|nr:hypothetical protein Cgig2_021922 [Carnegiea gigantea]
MQTRSGRLCWSGGYSPSRTATYPVLTKCLRLANSTEGGVSDLVAIDVKDLVNVVPRNGPGNKAKDYCINGFAIDNYSSLIEERQPLYPKWCQQSLFARTTKLKVAVALAVMKTDIYTDALMWEVIHVDFPQQDKYVKGFHLRICSPIGVLKSVDVEHLHMLLLGLKIPTSHSQVEILLKT